MARILPTEVQEDREQRFEIDTSHYFDLVNEPRSPIERINLYLREHPVLFVRNAFNIFRYRKQIQIVMLIAGLIFLAVTRLL